MKTFWCLFQCNSDNQIDCDNTDFRELNVVGWFLGGIHEMTRGSVWNSVERSNTLKPIRKMSLHFKWNSSVWRSALTFNKYSVLIMIHRLFRRPWSMMVNFKRMYYVNHRRVKWKLIVFGLLVGHQDSTKFWILLILYYIIWFIS